MNLFGRPRQQQAAAPTAAPRGGGGATDVPAAIMKLRGTVDTLSKREVHIQKKIDAQVNEAKGHLAKKTPQARKAAMVCMKRKKMYEAEILKIQGAQMTLEQQAMALESSAMNQQTIEAMQIGAKAMQQARGNKDADDVGEIMDNIQEEMQVSEEIASQLAQPLGDEMDEDELMAELNELEELELETQLLQTPAVPVAPVLPGAGSAQALVPELPAAPASAIQVEGADADEEAALRELEASMMAA